MNPRLCLVWALVWTVSLSCCGRDPQKKAYRYMPDMVESVPYDAFAPNPNTATGQTLLAPPAGTISRGHLPYRFANTPEDAERAGLELQNPIPLTPEALARGKRVYENFCLVCHGTSGKGDGPLIPKYPNPPSLSSKTVAAFPAGRLYHVITVGSVSGLMAAYAGQIAPADRWRLVHYLQTLQGTGPISVPPAAPQASPEALATPAPSPLPPPTESPNRPPETPVAIPREPSQTGGNAP